MKTKGKNLCRTKTLQISFILCFVLLCFTSYLETKGSLSESWTQVYKPRQRVIKTIAIHNKKIFIGTGNGVKVSIDNGKTWKDFGTRYLNKDENGNASVNFLHLYQNKIYISTGFGAYVSGIEKGKWKKIFENSKSDSRSVNFTLVRGLKKYFCTNDGFWICSEKGCARLNSGLSQNPDSGNYEILSALELKGDLYIGTSNGVYKLIKGAWHDISEGIDKLPEGHTYAKYLLADSSGIIWLACGTGIYKYNGISWEKVSAGIKENNDGFKESFYLYENKKTLYAGTASGIYKLNGIFWEEVSFGIKTKENNKNVYSLIPLKNILYAATDEGLYSINLSLLSTVNPPTLKEQKEINSIVSASLEIKPELEKEKPKEETIVLKGEVEKFYTDLQYLEPSAIEVQKQALRFSSLPTDSEFKKYRAQARIRNIIPRISLDVNSTDTNSNYLQSQQGISTDVSLNNKFNSDKTLQFQQDGKTYKQFSIYWNTGQLIYDDEITNILNQARYTANIKENLLDDITRIYYQRRKAQLEKISLDDFSQREKIKRELEIAELTSQIDARTGGWFTAEIEKKKRYLTNEKK